MKLLIEIINARGTDITGQIVITENNMTLLEHETKRTGRPKDPTPPSTRDAQRARGTVADTYRRSNHMFGMLHRL